jgi:cytidylate kinase
MSLESDLRQAERAGISISKEKLIQLIRDIKQKKFVVVQGRDGSYVVIPTATTKR